MHNIQNFDDFLNETTTAQPSGLQLGQKYKGGIIVILNPDRKSGLVMQEKDQPGMGEDSDLSNWYFAVDQCEASRDGGSGGWRLPSVEEFKEICKNRMNFGPFFQWLQARKKDPKVPAPFWTSKEVTADQAMVCWPGHAGTFQMWPKEYVPSSAWPKRLGPQPTYFARFRGVKKF